MINSHSEVSTYTAWKTFRNCRKKYWWRYVQQLVPIERDGAMYLGKLVHNALAEWHKTRDLQKAINLIDLETIGDPDPKVRLVATAMIEAYAGTYPMDADFDVLAVEKTLEGPIVNPATGFKSLTFTLGAKVDMLIEHHGTYLVEHKTTSRIDAPYLERLWTDFQVILYKHLIEQSLEIKIKGVIYNIIQKPGLKQYEAGKTRKVAETDEEFQARLLAKCLEPGMFHREELLIDESQIRQVQSELWELTQAYLEARRRDAWYQNTDHCFIYNKSCPYFRLCRSGDSQAIRENFYRIESPNQELEEVPAEETTF